jgi:glutamate:GABA antiporter
MPQNSGSSLERVLGPLDLALMQVLFVVQPTWIAVAATAGRGHVVLWCAALFLFYVPLAVIVTHLTILMPVEGGLYEWAKIAFGDSVGFFAAWYLWLSTVTGASLVGLEVTTYLSYCFGRNAPAETSVMERCLVTFVCIACIVLFSILGLSVGKRLNGIGSVILIVLLSCVALFPFFRTLGGAANHQVVGSVYPPLSLSTLNVFSKMAFGALSGFEMLAVLAGESREPGKSLTLSVILAAPVISLLYIFSTASVVALVAPGQLDLIAILPQALSSGLPGSFSLYAVRFTALALLVVMFGKRSLMFNICTRLPMVVGWDRILPSWFGRIDPRFKTPVNSILFVGCVMLALAIAGTVGIGIQEGFQFLFISGIVFYALTYLLLFMIPLCRPNFGKKKISIGLRLLAVPGLVITSLYLLLSIFPVIPVANQSHYSLKIIGFVIVTTLIGLVVYKRRNWMQSKDNAQTGQTSSPHSTP